ncbi:hypothetical protein KC726_00730 [Candidatus Woesebacteria bacterium]|nr:hypothetical protein [Candidatus Woesebacteria bacterium]
MKKETILAIVFGATCGILVAVVMLISSGGLGRDTKIVPVAQEANNKNVTSSTAGNKIANLTISQPESGIVVDANEITISGDVAKNSLIVMQSPAHQIAFKNDKETFSYNFPLAKGENMIQISAYTDNSTPQQITLYVYYVNNE